MSPLMIEILLHYHCGATDYPDLSPPAQQDAICYFLKEGYLVKNQLHEDMPAGSMNYLPTEKLHFYCKCLCEMPEPIQIWTIPSSAS